MLTPRLRSAAKTGVRGVARRLGYDVVPFTGGMTSLQRSLLARDIGTAIDVGANTGQYAERLRDLGFRSQIMSFEPGPAAFSILQAKARHDPRWKVRPVALGSSAGTGTLHVSRNSVSSSLLEVTAEHTQAAPGAATIGAEEVPISTLDHEILQAGVAGPYWVKLDVQGYEMAVLAGGQMTLAQASAVQVEVSFPVLYSGQASWLELASLLEERGFALRAIEPGYEDPDSGYLQQADLLFVRL